LFTSRRLWSYISSNCAKLPLCTTEPSSTNAA
jgi:hypothetical protein